MTNTGFTNTPTNTPTNTIKGNAGQNAREVHGHLPVTRPHQQFCSMQIRGSASRMPQLNGERMFSTSGSKTIRTRASQDLPVLLRCLTAISRAAPAGVLSSGRRHRQRCSISLGHQHCACAEAIRCAARRQQHARAAQPHQRPSSQRPTFCHETPHCSLPHSQ